MPVKCSNCGEELLGAVNRCWRCGKAFVTPPSDAPPVRRQQPTNPSSAQSQTNALAEEPLAAELVDADNSMIESEMQASAVRSQLQAPPAIESRDVDAKTSNDASHAAEQNSIAARNAHDHAGADATSEEKTNPLTIDERNNVPVRRGSPFADSATPRTRHAVAGTAPGMSNSPALAANYPQHTAATGGAIGALVLGILSLLSSFFVRGVGSVFVFAPVFLAMIGVGMGVWGLYSEKRGVALAGMLFCCIALAVAGFFGAVVLFEEINGYSPFDSPPVEVDGLDAEF